MEWIAELGSNHKGSRDLAYRMVREAAHAGATIIKFQAGRDPTDPIRYADDFLPEAFQWCQNLGVEFLASIWSQEGLEMCQKLGMKRRKIAHQQADVTNNGTKQILAEGLPTFVSVDLQLSKNSSFYWDKKINQATQNITWLAVSSIYPDYAYPLERRYSDKFLAGYSDHTHGIAAPLCAIAQGAKVIECHFTLDPTEESIKDNHFACTPAEFATMVRLGNEIALLGDPHGKRFRRTTWN